jgi:hypothetical protein
MLTVEHATPDEFIEALSLIKEHEAQVEIPGLSWDQEWAQSNYQDKDNYSIFRAGDWIGFLSLELLPDALFVHTLQLTPEAQGSIWGFRVYEWILIKAASFGKHRIECNVLKDSSASALYLRLGFELVHTDTYLSKMQFTFAS